MRPKLLYVLCYSAGWLIVLMLLAAQTSGPAASFSLVKV
jgi:hypothetical protein